MVRPDKSSFLGVVTGIAPRQLLCGEEVQVAVIQWKSGKTPRQCLGSNGAEAQAITEGENEDYQIRGLLLEFMAFDWNETVFMNKSPKFLAPW